MLDLFSYDKVRQGTAVIHIPLGSGTGVKKFTLGVFDDAPCCVCGSGSGHELPCREASLEAALHIASPAYLRERTRCDLARGIDPWFDACLGEYVDCVRSGDSASAIHWLDVVGMLVQIPYEPPRISLVLVALADLVRLEVF
jgi:hypothetical protein